MAATRSSVAAVTAPAVGKESVSVSAWTRTADSEDWEGLEE